MLGRLRRVAFAELRTLQQLPTLQVSRTPRTQHTSAFILLPHPPNTHHTRLAPSHHAPTLTPTPTLSPAGCCRHPHGPALLLLAADAPQQPQSFGATSSMPAFAPPRFRISAAILAHSSLQPHRTCLVMLLTGGNSACPCGGARAFHLPSSSRYSVTFGSAKPIGDYRSVVTIGSIGSDREGGAAEWQRALLRCVVDLVRAVDHPGR